MLFKACLVVLVVWIALDTIQYKRVLNLVEKGIKPLNKHLSAFEIETLQNRVVRAVRAVARRFLGNRPCLPQALATKWLLGREGIHSDLKIGVTKNENAELEAHAWLAVNGTIIIGGRTSPRFYAQLQTTGQSGS